MNDETRQEYLAMRDAQSTRQMKWIAAFNKNPELASAVLDIFEMPEEDSRLILRILNNMKDSLRLYREDIRPKKKSRSTPVVMV